MRNPRVLSVAALGIVLMIASAATLTASAVSGGVNLSSQPAIVQVGETVDVDFVITVPQGTTGYGAYTAEVTYNPALVSVECVGGRATCNAHYAINRIILVDVALPAFPGGKIETLRFTGIAPGAFSFSYNITTCTNTEGVSFDSCTGSGGGIQVEGGGGLPTATPTSSIPSPTPTDTATATATTAGATPTNTATATGTATSTPTKTATPTMTPTPDARPFKARAIYTSRDID